MSKQLGQFSLKDKIPAEADLSSYFNLKTDNTVSGNTDFLGSLSLSADLSVIGGNFAQTDVRSEYVKNYSPKNSFIQAESLKNKIACTGSRGYCILGVMPETKQLKLSGDISELERNLDEKFSWLI